MPIVRSPLTRADLAELASARFGDMVKADVDRRTLARDAIDGADGERRQ